jgi:hypothetical protein
MHLAALYLHATTSRHMHPSEIFIKIRLSVVGRDVFFFVYLYKQVEV